jgi:hypothetical protein
MASNQHSTREREIKLLPQTHSPKVDYSLFIIVAVLLMLERLEKQLGMALAAFPPPIFTGLASVSWFRVSPPHTFKNTLGSLYIGVFRLSPQSEIKMDIIGGTMAK